MVKPFKGLLGQKRRPSFQRFQRNKGLTPSHGVSMRDYGAVERSVRRKIWIAPLVLILLVGFTSVAQAQVSPEVQAELNRRGMTAAEALQEAERYGVDTSSPQALERTARELGFSEDAIGELRRLLEERESQPSPFDRNIYTFQPQTDSLVAADDSLLVSDSLAAIRKRDKIEERRQERNPYADLIDESSGLEYFGYRTFRNAAETGLEQPSDMQPADDAYVVGGGDNIRLAVYGAAEFSYELAVDRGGRVNVPGVGLLTVAGTTLGDLQRRFERFLSSRYAGIITRPQTVFVDVSITRLRPVRVFVTGEVERPGAYTLGAGGGVFNLLYQVGGPTTRGSLRSIQVSRGGRIIANIDAYDYLLEGREPEPLNLQSGDRILVPVRGKTAYVDGSVSRPGIYEMRDDERFEDLIRFAGWLLPEAYVARFQVERIIPFTERRDPTISRQVLDLDLRSVLTGISEYSLADGDRVTIFAIDDVAESSRRGRLNAVIVDGAVFQPGRFELGDELRTVSDLLDRADGLTDDAYRQRANLVRNRPNLRREIVALDLSRVLADDPTQNLPLSAGDSLYVYSERQFERERVVRIEGQVLNPGEYALFDGMTLYDLLFVGGGLLDPEFRSDVFLPRADLYRRLDDGNPELIAFDLEQVLAGAGEGSMLLEPFDQVRIYPAEVEVIREQYVEISGAVKDPGRYPLGENMSVQDVILQAGGVVEGAYTDMVEVTRMDTTGDVELRAQTVSVPLAPGAPVVASRLPGGARVLTEHTFELNHRDRIYVRLDPDFRPQQTVSVRGEVRFPGTYTLLRENERLSEVIARAGGLTPRAYARGGQLIRGERQLIVEIDRSLGGETRADVPLLPGDQVTIPIRPNTVEVRGAVPNDGLIQYAAGRRVSYYLDRAGGINDNAENVFVTQASGAVFKLRRGLFSQNPIVDDGGVIYVSAKEERPADAANVGNVLRDTLAIAASAVTVIIPIILAFRN